MPSGSGRCCRSTGRTPCSTTARSSPAAGVFPFGLTVPGGALPCAGVTVVGVLPSHRRRGLLRRMMDAQLRDVRERGEPIAALWASEETIYGRFGYGLASLSHNIDAERHAVAIRSELPRDGLDAAGDARRGAPRRSRACTSASGARGRG